MARSSKSLFESKGKLVKTEDGFQGYSRSELWLLTVIVLIGAIPRLLLLWKSKFIIESDEAIVGLMAKHILEGKPWPIFYYGQTYMGSLEAILASFSFLLLGQTGAALKLVPFLFSLLHIALVYGLARRFLNVGWSALAALLTALAPNGLILWSSMARGGFIELVAIGSLSLILTVDILRRGVFDANRIIVLGLVLGLGWWVNNQILFYMAPIGLMMAYFCLSRFSFPLAVRAAFLAVAAFFLGGLPFWYHNLMLTPRFSTFGTLFGNRAGDRTWEYLEGYFTKALPIIFGARHFWSESDIFTGGSILTFASYAVVLIVVCCALLGFSGLGGKKVTTQRSPLVLLLLFCVFVPVIFASSSFGWLSQAPRYLLPLYSVLFVLVAIASQVLWSRSSVLLRAFGVAIPLVLLGVHLNSSYSNGVAIAGQPFVFRGDRVAESHDELYAWLKRENYNHIHTNYWIGYRVAFETAEAVTFSRYGNPKTLRIKSYEDPNREKSHPAVFVLVPREAELFSGELELFGYDFRSTKVGNYVVIDQLRTKWPRGEQIPVDYRYISATSRPEQVGMIVDGDRSSRWGSGMPQRPGMAVEISFPNPELVSGLDLDLGQFVHDAPRDLVVEGVTPEGNKLTLFRLQGTKIFKEIQAEETSEVDPEWKISFMPQKLKQIRLLQQGSTPVFDWSIAELKLYRPSDEAIARARLQDFKK